MNRMNRSGWVFLLLIGVFCACSGLFAEDARAVPASPDVVRQLQPDGTEFEARMWGDEWSHGWETLEGFAIVKDKDTGFWSYAVHDETGRMVSSGKIVGREAPSGLRRQLRPAGQTKAYIDSMKTSSYFTQDVQDVSPTGVANVLTILINFHDRTVVYDAADFETLLYSEGNHSLKDYYQEVSYGAFSVTSGPGGILGWYRARYGHDYYGQNGLYDRDLHEGTLVREAVMAADDAGFDFAPYDQDGDCYVDLVSIIHQGTGEEVWGSDPRDLWSGHWNLNDAHSHGRSDGPEYVTNCVCSADPTQRVRVNRYTIQPELLRPGLLATIGIYAHEYGHALGLPDLYDTDQTSEGIGRWSLMASGSWNRTAQSGDRPGHLDAWSKYWLGWASLQRVTGMFLNEAIRPAVEVADVYKFLRGDPDDGEYFLVENRARTGFDAGLPAEGLLVWHVDAEKEDNTEECFPPDDCSEEHYKVALVQADGLWDLEQNRDRGDSGDPFAGPAQAFVSDNTIPSTRLWSGEESDVSISSVGPAGFYNDGDACCWIVSDRNGGGFRSDCRRTKQCGRLYGGPDRINGKSPGSRIRGLGHGDEPTVAVGGCGLLDSNGRRDHPRGLRCRGDRYPPPGRHRTRDRGDSGDQTRSDPGLFGGHSIACDCFAKR